MAKIQSLNSVPGKETIYVDVDDEITAIIDKVTNAKGKVVALVLPKRAPVLQSVVNMKLLKRSADNTGKNLVLITSEAGLMPLAGSVGMHVASTPSSKPSIPPVPAGPGDEPESIEEPLDIVDGTTDEGEDFDSKSAAGKSIGELAAAGAAGKIAEDSVDESIDMSDEADDAAAVAPAVALKKNKKLKVPNFNSFRQKLALGIAALVVLIAVLIFALVILPAAAVTIHTDSNTIPTNLNLTLSTAAKTLDPSSNTVPATLQSQQKTSTQQVPATGQVNNGQKASGSVTMTLCDASFIPPSNVSAGVSISQGGLTYITQETTQFTQNGPPNGHCQPYKSVGSTDIIALKGGANYNVSNANFTVTGRSEITASGSASGGTDNITKVVQQSDIDGATAKITAADTNSIKQQLQSGLESKGLLPISVTFLPATPQVTTSAKAGDATDSVTVTAVTTYTMLGVSKNDLKTLVDANVTKQLDKGKQVILDDGVSNADFTEVNPATATGAQVSMAVKSQVGPDLNVNALKAAIKGMKAGDVKGYITQTPGVSSVDVTFSPFWVNSVPKKASKITIKIVKANS